MLLSHIYDATHEPRCALQIVRPGILSKPVRMAAAIHLYRKLTGDLSSSKAGLSADIEGIRRKRMGVANTPSAALRRWLSEMPSSCASQGPWCDDHRCWTHICGCQSRSGIRTSSRLEPSGELRHESRASSSPAVARPESCNAIERDAGSGASRDLRLSSGAWSSPRQSSPRRPRAQTPPPSSYARSSRNSIGELTRPTGRNTANFASKVVAHEVTIRRQAASQGQGADGDRSWHKHRMIIDETHALSMPTPGPGSYDTDGDKEMATSRRSSHM